VVQLSPQGVLLLSLVYMDHLDDGTGYKPPAKTAAPALPQRAPMATPTHAAHAPTPAPDPDARFAAPALPQRKYSSGSIKGPSNPALPVVGCPTCAYSSPNGNCNRPVVPGSMFCVLHRCPAPGCTAHKSSRSEFCPAHLGARGFLQARASASPQGHPGMPASPLSSPTESNNPFGGGFDGSNPFAAFEGAPANAPPPMPSAPKPQEKVYLVVSPDNVKPKTLVEKATAVRNTLGIDPTLNIPDTGAQPTCTHAPHPKCLPFAQRFVLRALAGRGLFRVPLVVADWTATSTLVLPACRGASSSSTLLLAQLRRRT